MPSPDNMPLPDDLQLVGAVAADPASAAAESLALQATRIDALVQRIASRPLTFPTSTHLALRVVDAINAPGCSLVEAARLLQLEPLLSAKVVAVSNSVAFNRSGRSIHSVQDAVQLIGLKMLKALAISVVMRQMAAGAVPSRRPVARRLWDHSVHVAALSYVIARQLTGAPADAAMFAGMVHELTGFYMLSLPYDLLDMDDAELGMCLIGGSDTDVYADEAEPAEPLASRVGRPLLEAIRVPEPIIEAVSVTWRGYLELPPTSLGDTLMLADILSPVRSPFEPEPGASDTLRYPEIDLIMGREQLTRVIEQSQSIIDSLLGALRG